MPSPASPAHASPPAARGTPPRSTPYTPAHAHLPGAAELPLTQHARVRLQQRGIPRWYLQLLLDHGQMQHDGHGATVLTVNHRVRQRLRFVLNRTEYARAERYFGVYAVVSPDAAVITAARRTRRAYLH